MVHGRDAFAASFGFIPDLQVVELVHMERFAAVAGPRDRVTFMKRRHLVPTAVDAAKTEDVVARDETTALLGIALEGVGPDFVQEGRRNRYRRKLPIDLDAAAHRGHVSGGSEACYQLLCLEEAPWPRSELPTSRSPIRARECHRSCPRATPCSGNATRCWPMAARSTSGPCDRRTRTRSFVFTLDSPKNRSIF